MNTEGWPDLIDGRWFFTDFSWLKSEWMLDFVRGKVVYLPSFFRDELVGLEIMNFGLDFLLFILLALGTLTLGLRTFMFGLNTKLDILACYKPTPIWWPCNNVFWSYWVFYNPLFFFPRKASENTLIEISPSINLVFLYTLSFFDESESKLVSL